MNYQYFADKPDKIDILNYIFSETDLQVFELSSEYGKEIRQFGSIEEIVTCFDLHLEGTGATFLLWSSRHGRKPSLRRIDLDPRHCNGFTFRYATQGLGMIQFYFGGVVPSGLSGITQPFIKNSTIAHHTRVSAKNYEGQLNNGLVGEWNWDEIEKTSRALKNFIAKKLVVSKIGSYGILKGAQVLYEQGVKIGNETVAPIPVKK